MPESRIFFGNQGGGGPATIEIQEGGVPVVGAATTLNFTGNVTVVDSGGGVAEVQIGGGGGAGYNQVVYHTLTTLEIANKQLQLPSVPLSPALMLVDQANGTPSLLPGVDFTVAGDIVDWNGFGMDGVVAEGDIIRFAYTD